MLGFYEPARLHMDSPIVDTVEEFVAIKKSDLPLTRIAVVQLATSQL